MTFFKILKNSYSLANDLFDKFYNNWHANISAMNSFFYKQLKSDEGWININGYNQMQISLFSKIISSGRIYATFILLLSDGIKSFFNSKVFYIFILLAMSLIITELGIYFSYLSFERK
jgi:hypothetical protein